MSSPTNIEGKSDETKDSKNESAISNKNSPAVSAKPSELPAAAIPNAPVSKAESKPIAAAVSAPVTISTVAAHSKSVLKIDPHSPEWRCAICHTACTQQCSLCKEVAYCGKDHQRDDWKSHKLTCRGYIPTSDVKCKVIYDYDSRGIRRGRKLIAAKAIKQGEIFLKELPLVWVPKHDIRPQPWKAILDQTEIIRNIMSSISGVDGANENNTSSPEDEKSSACIVCGQVIPDSSGHRACTQCSWPVCSEQCELNTLHEKECQVFQGNHIPRHIQQLLPNRFLFVLRCLLLQGSDPKKWRHLMELEYNPQEMTKKYSPTHLFSDDEDDEQSGGSTVSPNSKYDVGISKLLKYYGIKCEVEWVTHLMKVIKWNVIYDYEYDSRAMIFHLASAAHHCCLPNAEAVFKQSDMRLHIRALLDIKAGEPITITRDPLALMLTAQIRQHRLKYLTGWDGFRCNCARCSDWTELGTNFATLQCRKELKNWSFEASASDPSPCTGTLFATRPLDQNFEWKCATCKFRVTGDLSQDKLRLKNLLSQTFHQADPDSSYIADGVKTADSFLYWFHPNHSFLFQTKLRLMDTVNLLSIKGMKKGKWDETKIDAMVVDGFDDMALVTKLVQFGTDCKKVADSIFPGYSRIRGHIQQFLGFGKWTLFKLGRERMDETKQPDFIHYSEHHLLEEALGHLADARKILSFYKDVKEDEKAMVKFSYNLSRGIEQIVKVPES